MASSGSFSGSIHSGHYVLRVDWTQTKNISANTSTVTAKAYLVNDWSLSIYGRSDNSITINGTAQIYESPAVNGTGTHLLGTVTQTVNHNSDGTKSLTMSAVFYIRATLSGTYYESITASANITLDSIARASSVSTPNATMGSATAIAISRASSSFTHTLTYTFGTAAGTIATKTTSTSVSWTPPLSLASQIPKAVTGTCTVTCTTYNGSTKIGSKTCTLTLTVPASIKPTITSLTAARVDGAVPGTWGIYVQTKSKATLTINGAAGSYGSTISSYSITGGGYTSTASSFTTGFLNTSGMVTFTATVTDSRGRVSAAATVSISVVAYSPPSFASYLSQRCLSNGTVNDDGTYIRGLVSYSYASCSSKNTITRATYYKKASDTAWTNANAAFSSGTAFTFGGGNISTETSYDIKYTLTDAFTTITIQDIVSTAAVVMDFKRGGKGVAVGKVSEKDNTFEVAEDWDVRVYGKLLKDYIQSFIKTLYPVGSIYMSVNATNPSAYFGGTWVAWGAGRVPVGINTADGNFNTVEKTGGAATVTLTTAQMPAHTHTFTGSSATTSSKGAHTHNVGRDGDGASGSSTYTVHSAGVSGAGGTSPTNSAGAHTHTLTAKGTNANTGGGGAHSNLQPYIVCYMWKRTA
ncbi:MAG TPA: pilus assembly protein [Lachnospiraceae bacterium]|nr:pilus assembly protein [Lachnospiraceae bacterium]